MPLEISEIGVRMDVTEDKPDSNAKTQNTLNNNSAKPETTPAREATEDRNEKK